MDEAVKIVNDIKNGQIKPIYFLMGEEAYYIDKIADYIEQNVLTEDEKGFNQTVLYGRDVTIEDIIGTAKRFPMMADRQVIIVKEAQDLSRTIEQIERYTENPVPTSVLVFCYKYKTIDKRKKFTKNIEKLGVLFESKKLYENQVGDWINRVLKSKGYGIEPKATAMLVEFLGTDLSKINNELEKLQIVLPKQSTITAIDIEDNIGFSKDFNVFELRKAIGERNQLKAYQIVHYFSENPKENPILMVTALIFGYFQQLLQYHGLKDKSSKNVAAALKISPYFTKDYELAARNFPMKKVSVAIAKLREMDVKSKGVGANSLPLNDLYREMLIALFN
ncbi:MAG: DNA polymerase III subunit delta [Flavobacterium sp.]|nr:DNA polymerase III subunit delta [Flavobacterium sp.]